MKRTIHGRVTIILGISLSVALMSGNIWAAQPGSTSLTARRLARSTQLFKSRFHRTSAFLSRLGRKPTVKRAVFIKGSSGRVIVRTGQTQQQGQTSQVQPEPETTTSAPAGEPVVVWQNCPTCPPGFLGFGGWSARARYYQTWQGMQHWLGKKFAYFIPSGCGGAGCPPFGDYHLVYAVQPNYLDPRDSQIFAAPGVGVPVAVPLAPVVHYQYNYSHGIPASRITPVWDVVPPQRVDY